MKSSHNLSLLKLSDFSVPFSNIIKHIEARKPRTDQDSKSSTYNVPVAAKKRILMKAKKSWKYKKATLYAVCDEFLKNGTVAELRNNVPEGVKKED